MEKNRINLHVNKMRAFYIMLFFAILLSLNGALAVVTVSKDYAQLNSLLHSEYEYSVTSRNPINKDSYYLFDAGINYSKSLESSASINADVLMQYEGASYTELVDWNAQKLNTDSIAISEGIAKTIDIAVGDKVYSKHIVDGEIHAYTVEQILPDVCNIRVIQGKTFSDGVIIMGTDDLYIKNISHSYVIYTNMPFNDLVREISEVPENIVYRSDEIMEVVKVLLPYLIMFISLSAMIVVILSGLLTKEIKCYFRRLTALGYANDRLDIAYWKHIFKETIPATFIGLFVSMVATFLSRLNSVKIAVLLIIFITEAVALLLATLLHKSHLWR